VMRGEYDALQKWPFTHKVTMMLLDQSNKRSHLVDYFRPDPDSSSFKRPLSDMNVASGSPLFATHQVVESPSNNFVVDDTLFIAIKIDTSNIEII